MITDQLKRIKKYEKMMRKAQRLLEDYTEDNADALRGYIEKLEAYYTSDEWKRDFADDEAGLLPSDLKRGVLSEDGLYDLIEQYKEMSQDRASQAGDESE